MPDQLSGHHRVRYWIRLGVVAAVLGLVAIVAGWSPAEAQDEDGGLGYMIIDTLAGTGEWDSSGDGGPATEAAVNQPRDVVVDDEGNVYLASVGAGPVRRVDPEGTITTIAGGDDSDDIGRPRALAVDDAGNLYTASATRVYSIAPDGAITTVAGTGELGFGGDGGPATDAQLNIPGGLATDGSGNLYIADTKNERVRKVDPEGTITTIAGGGDPDEGIGDGGPATEAELESVNDVEVDDAGNVFMIAHGGLLFEGPPRVRKVDNDGTITTVAGGGEPRHGIGDGGPATEAELNRPYGLALGADGSVFISDQADERVRKVDPEGVITTVAGGGEPDDGLGDRLPPTQARLDRPIGIDVDETIGPVTETRGLVIADQGDNRVRQVTRVPSLVRVHEAAGSEPINLDEELTYTWEVVNDGLAGTATGVTLTDELSDEVEFVSADPTQGECSEDGGTLACDLGELAEGATASVTVTLQPTAAGVVVENNASVTANEDDPLPENQHATSTTPVGDAGCGQLLTEDTTLGSDLGPCHGNGLVIGADDITLDLNGHTVSGFRQFSESDIEKDDRVGTSDEAGVRLTGRRNVTVQNGIVTGFAAGVRLEGGDSHTVQDLELHENLGLPGELVGALGPMDYPLLGDGIFVWDSTDNLVVDNDLRGNGQFTGIFVGGFEAHNNTVKRNTVEGTVGTPNYSTAGQGIMVNAAGLGGTQATMIHGNEVLQNVVRHNGSAGITSINHRDGEIMGNTVEGNGTTHRRGHGIAVSLGEGIDDAGINLTIRGNEVHDNDVNGIELGGTGSVSFFPDEVRVLNNNVSGSGGLDLLDKRPECGDNVWRNNTWSDSGYDPECTTEGGRGPQVRTDAHDQEAEQSDVPDRFPEQQNSEETGESGES